MEEDQEMRFVCKLCDKRYPSGKSLGGHMRSHVIAAAAAANSSADLVDERFDEPLTMKKLSSFDGNGNGNSSYGLRENPKKTWRAVDSSFPSPQERVCKQCGKGFQSLKALCGHMACHSDKERGLKDYDHSWTSENQKLVMDSHSDTEEAEDPTRLTRSKTKRYKRIINVVKPASSFYHLGNTSSNNYGSSSVTEIDELEQEEVAMCLMMLSKDSGGGNWVGVNSVVESSDNNSVVLETKSSSIDMRVVGGRKEWDSTDERLEFKKGGVRKLKASVVFDAAETDQSVPFENSNSGYYYRNGVKRVESDVSVDHEMHSKGDQYNKSKGISGGGGRRIEFFDKKLGKGGFNRDRDVCYEKSEFNKNLIKQKSYDSRKRTRDEMYDPQVREESVKKKSKYECLNCNKTFTSFQGLGGHRPCHKKSNASFAAATARYESGENSIEDEVPDWKPKKLNAKDQSREVEKKIKSKKSKVHECPICYKHFKSGQALGGHKRSHFLNSSEDKFNHIAVMEKDLIDLNLPAPEED